ncbi:MAG: sigma-70 family RNA polymerase sigma factor [Sedimentisphaerales bacterium]|nr:sigma-70 family RNA polymerase sigma factor [Sedimentisphaerales bacterium]
MVEDKPDSVLVEGAIRGEGDSFTELCGRYYGPMVAIADAILGDRHLAEDAAQQAFAKAAVSLPSLHKPERFGSWLAAICRNAARDLLRGGEKCCSADALPAVQAERHDDDVGDAVREALRRLEPPAREVIYLRFYDGLSYEQISAILGISEQAINGRLRRAKRTLATYLRRQGLDEVQI